MFVGREKELLLLESLYDSNRFEMLVVHGRRRVGKSFLLSHFANRHRGNTIFFTADKSSERVNVENFCSEMKNIVKTGDFLGSFSSWYDVFSFLGAAESTERTVIVMDEFTYLLKADPSFDSKLQNAIDRILKQRNVFLILCGSEISVMERLFDDSSKPLYGRKTAELKLEPFSYTEARRFFPNYNEEDSIVAYSILGGIPLYLSLFDDSLSIRDNVIKNCLESSGYLFNEVETLLQMELKESGFYKEILLAINSGALALGEIKNKVSSDSAKIAKYLAVLMNLGIIKKETPCGERERSRNTLYSMADNYFAFYFQFIYRNRNSLNGLIPPAGFFDRFIGKERLGSFIGHRFEGICESYLKARFYAGRMPFYATDIGRWWGGSRISKEPVEIDVLALDDENALICECKYTERPFDEKQLSDLFESGTCIDRKNKYYMIFSKSGVTSSVLEKVAGLNNFKIVGLLDLFERP